MMLFSKLLLMLWAINFAPPLLSVLMEKKWDRPVDCNFNLPDGRPLFGNHKTIRGLLAGIISGALAGISFGFPLWLCLGAGFLSMCGDLFSSFLKRRLSFSSGDVVPGVDQIPEGFLPFLLLGPQLSLSVGYIFLVGIVFGIGAYYGSAFLNDVLFGSPFEAYPRKIRPITRARELIRCQITTRPFHYLLSFEDAVYYHLFMKSAFKLLGIYERGRKNALVVEKREVSFEFQDLPPAFDGYKILFLSDLHMDGLEGLPEIAAGIIQQLHVDLCILGGDFRMKTHGPSDKAMELLGGLLQHIHATDKTIAVLGNHDCVEMIAPLKKEGVTVLLNDSLAIERDGRRLWIVGADDCHFFKSHDLPTAFAGLQPDSFVIFVSHSNEIYREASAYRPRLFLCGHTHGGQIKIPPFGPIFTHSSAPRRMCEGKWQYDDMTGYTSNGVGVSGVPVRFNSKGEVTVITLRKIVFKTGK